MTTALILAALIAATPGAPQTVMAPAPRDPLPPSQSAFSCQDGHALTARFAFHKRRPLRTWSILGALTLLLAGPNLLTLGIVIGTGNAAHAGERILDVDAPGFRGATLAGVMLAALLLALLQYQLVSRHRTGRRLDRANERLAAREPSPPPPPEPPSS